VKFFLLRLSSRTDHGFSWQRLGVSTQERRLFCVVAGKLEVSSMIELSDLFFVDGIQQQQLQIYLQWLL
jgi:hypothetical protein